MTRVVAEHILGFLKIIDLFFRIILGSLVFHCISTSRLKLQQLHVKLHVKLLLFL